MSEFIHYIWEKSLSFMLVLVGHGERRFSLQINITKDITAIVRRVKDFSMISFPRIFLLYGILITLSILYLTVNTQPAIACSGLIMEVLEQHMGYVQGWSLCICICMCIYIWMCVCVYVYICICVCVCVCVCVYVCVCIYVNICIDISYLSSLLGLGVVGTFFWCYCYWLWAIRPLLGISDVNSKISFN